MLLIESKDGRSKMQCSSIYSYGFARKPPAGAGARSFVPCLEWLTNPAVGFLLFDTQRMQWRILCHTPVPDEEISWVAIYLNAIDFFGWFSKDALRGFRLWTSLIDNMTNDKTHIMSYIFTGWEGTLSCYMIQLSVWDDLASMPEKAIRHPGGSSSDFHLVGYPTNATTNTMSYIRNG